MDIRGAARTCTYRTEPILLASTGVSSNHEDAENLLGHEPANSQSKPCKMTFSFYRMSHALPIDESEHVILRALLIKVKH